MTDNEKVVISYKDKTLELPVVEATAGSSAMDISKLHSTLGLHTYDQGFVNTASTKSAITFTPMACLLSAHADADIINVSFEASAFMVAENSKWLICDV